MRFFKINLIGVLVIAFCSSALWSADAAWKKIGESKGIVGFTRPTNRSSVDEMKGIGVVDAPVAVVEAVLRDVPAETEYMYRCKEASVINTPELKSSSDIVYLYNVTSMPFPVSDRDVVARASYTIDKAARTVYLRCEGIKSPYMSERKRVRMPMMEAEYILAPKGPDKTEVTYTALADPGGNLPSVAVNLLTKNLSIQTIAGIREMAKKDKYKNARAIITATPR